MNWMKWPCFILHLPGRTIQLCETPPDDALTFSERYHSRRVSLFGYTLFCISRRP
jgi:hypothetical protein